MHDNEQMMLQVTHKKAVDYIKKNRVLNMLVARKVSLLSACEISKEITLMSLFLRE